VAEAEGTFGATFLTSFDNFTSLIDAEDRFRKLQRER
jgi:hypothetical protein